MATKLITAASVEPLTLTQTKDHLRVTHTTDDALISALIPGARRYAEHYTRRALITQVWELLIDEFPYATRESLEIPFAPLQSIDSITYYDTDGAEQTLPVADYQVDSDSEPGRVAPVVGVTWPGTEDRLNAVTIRFTAGYGDSPGDVPEGIGQAMLMMIGHLYERRETTIVGTIIAEVPFATKALLDPYKIMKAVC